MWDRASADAGCSINSDDVLPFKVKRNSMCQLGNHSDSPRTRRFVCGQCGFAGSSRLSLSMHMTQVHRPRKLAVRTRSKCLEAKLYHRLRLSNSQQRQEMLENLSQVQRLALERWILVHSEKDGQENSGFKKRKLGSTKNLRRQPLCTGVRRSNRGYFVSTCCGGHFQLFARKAADIATAKRQYEILQELRRAVEQRAPPQRARGAAPGALGQVFAETVQSRVEELRRVGFSFTVRVPAKYWIGRELRSPRYSLERLQLGLSALRRLQRARQVVHRGHANRYSIFAHNSPAEMESAWLHLRDEYLEVWAEAGWSREALLRRLQRLEAPRKSRRLRAIAAA